MNILEFSRRNVVSAILLTAMISPAIAFSAQPDRPLKGSFVTQEQAGFRPDCPSKFGGTTTGTGTSTHLGKVSFTAIDCITPIEKENYFTFTGRLTLITANGDKLTGNYSGSFKPVDSGSIYTLSDAKFEIKGGTGRFADAEGTAGLKGNQDILTGKGKIELDGTISY